MASGRIGRLVPVGAIGVGLALYALTAPDGLPWNESVHLAQAYLGEIVRLPAMPHPVWGRLVRGFGDPVVLSCVSAALAAGFLGALVNRYLGWRVAFAAAIAWLWMPAVWNRAITGERSVALASAAVAEMAMRRARSAQAEENLV